MVCTTRRRFSVCAESVGDGESGEFFRSRESGDVGAAPGLARLALRRREGAGAMGHRYGTAEQPLGAASGTLILRAEF